MVDPFWDSVAEAYDQVAAHPHTHATVARGNRVARVLYEPTTNNIMVVISLAEEAGRLPTKNELKGNE